MTRRRATDPHAAKRRRQAGFTVVEVLVALLVFAISVVGLVAMESRAIESQKASAEIRDAERIAQEVMADLTSRGYLELIERDFAGNPNPAFPYDDSGVPAENRVRDFRRPPADIPAATNVAGSVRGQYIVFRSVDWVIHPNDPPSSNPPVPGIDEGRIRALVLQVQVLWIDTTNPTFPPPADLRVVDLTPSMTVPGDPDFRPYVGSVTLNTIRANDAQLWVP